MSTRKCRDVNSAFIFRQWLIYVCSKWLERWKRQTGVIKCGAGLIVVDYTPGRYSLPVYRFGNFQFFLRIVPHIAVRAYGPVNLERQMQMQMPEPNITVDHWRCLVLIKSLHIDDAIPRRHVNPFRKHGFVATQVPAAVNQYSWREFDLWTTDKTTSGI